LLRKFAEGQGQSAGEFYTPRVVGVLMAKLLNPEPGMTAYDPACGSAGLLIKCHLDLVERYGEQVNGRKVLPSTVAPLRAYGQEINPTTFAMARMNAFIHDIEAEIALGDTMRRPSFLNDDGRTVRPRYSPTFKRGLGLGAAHGRFAQSRRAHGCAGYRLGLAG
jgi:type I restriction enzyme M protein